MIFKLPDVTPSGDRKFDTSVLVISTILMVLIIISKLF
jgi:hypothetical protein